MAFNKPNRKTVGDIRSTSGKGCVIWIVASVVLSVSLLSCVTYIGLMSGVFPSGIFQVLCYLGAFANFILMCALLWGKFVWFRPGLHEYASWGVNLVEILVCVLNLVLAFQLNTTTVAHLGTMGIWYMLAPISPVFSMVGAIILILTSDDLKRKHKDMQVEEEKAEAQQDLELEQHRATIDVQRTYVSFVATEMANHLSSPAIQKVIADQARIMVTQTIGQLSGMSVSPQFQPLTIVDADTVSLAQNVQTRNDDNPPQAAPVPATPVAPTQGGSEGANPLSPVEPQQIQTTPPVKKSLPKTRKKII